MLAALATKFQGLRSDTSLDHAQLARHVAAGDGFQTSVIRPLALVFHTDLRRHPEFYNAPAHPLVLALAYALAHPSDKVTAVVGGGLWIVSVWMVFAIARRWFDARVAVLAALFHGCNTTGIEAAIEGMPFGLAAIVLLLAFALAAPGSQAEEPPATRIDLPGWRLAWVGAACGMAAMTHYLMAVLALCLGILLVGTRRRRKGRALSLYAVGFLIPLIPWMWRNAQWGQSPLFSLYGYELLSGTDSYPGASVWRTLASLPPHPLSFAANHPGEVMVKWITGLAWFWRESLSVLNPVVAFLFLASLLGGAPSLLWRRLQATAAAGLVLTVAASCLFRPDPDLLLAWEPLLAIGAAAHLRSWIDRRMGKVAPVSLTEPAPDPRKARVLTGFSLLTQRWRRALAYLTAVGLAGFPLLYYFAVSRPLPDPRLPESMPSLQRRLPPNAAVMTDQPAFAAWRLDRPSVMLCRGEDDWDALENTCGPVDAAYVTPAVSRLEPRERSLWWFWVSSPRGTYRGLAPADPMPAGGTLRLRIR